MRPLPLVLAALVVALVLAGCGGNETAHYTTTPPTTAAPPPTTAPATTAPAGPTLTSASDLAACSELERNVRTVSQVVSGSIEYLTQSLHPKQLARRTGQARQSLLYSAKVIGLLDVPTSLVPAQRQLVAGLRQFGADFLRAQKSVQRGDLAGASQQLVDRAALAKVTAATKKIDRACGA